MEIDLERTPGFSNADGAERIHYKSANHAFNAFLKAKGLAPTKENKAFFKEWLKKAKESGKLEAVLKNPAEEIKKEQVAIENEVAVQNSNADGDQKPAPKKEMKILGMKPLLAVGVIAVSIGLISWGIYAVVKAHKKKQGGATA
jgi:hypothetical protein